MKKLAILLFFIFPAFSIAQSPENKVLNVKKVVKVGSTFYIEESNTTITYTELTKDMLFATDRDSDDEKQDEMQKKFVEDEAKRKKAERAERNRLIRSALRSGYEPDKEALTIEEKLRIDKIKEKLK